MNASNWPGLAIAKPEPRMRVKGRRQRGEKKVEKSVRAQCVERDGYCLIQTHVQKRGPSECAGKSEWAHIGKYRRSLTRGMAPEQRHTTKGSGMMCQHHHAAYDAHEFDILPSTDRGMDGPFKVVPR